MAHVGHSLFAHRIDEGLQLLFAKQLEGTLGPSAGDWNAEIALLVSAAYYLLSVLRRDKDGRERTAGMAVMGLQRLPLLPALLPEPRKTLLPLLFMVLVYCYQRLKRHALLHRWSARDATPLQQRLHRRLAVLETAAKILGLGHVVATLSAGAFPNIIYPLSLIAVGPETVALPGADAVDAVAAAPLPSSSSLSDASSSTATAAAAVLLPPAFRGLQPLIYVRCAPTRAHRPDGAKPSLPIVSHFLSLLHYSTYSSRRYHQLLWGSLRNVLFTGILQQVPISFLSASRLQTPSLTPLTHSSHRRHDKSPAPPSAERRLRSRPGGRGCVGPGCWEGGRGERAWPGLAPVWRLHWRCQWGRGQERGRAAVG